MVYTQYEPLLTITHDKPLSAIDQWVSAININQIVSAINQPLLSRNSRLWTKMNQY